jgi:hypothetical protein
VGDGIAFGVMRSAMRRAPHVTATSEGPKDELKWQSTRSTIIGMQIVFPIRRASCFAIAATCFLFARLAESFAIEPYWTISERAEDPFFTTGSSTGGLDTLYIWFLPCPVRDEGDGMSAAEFGLEGTLSLLALTPAQGFLNAGSITSPMFVVGGCPEGPVLAASILIQHDAPGFLCFGPSINGKNETVDCSEDPATFANHYLGYSSVGQSCSFDCFTSVESQSWGSIKSLYR